MDITSLIEQASNSLVIFFTVELHLAYRILACVLVSGLVLSHLHLILY